MSMIAFKENMIVTKIKTYIGFAIRMKKATFGVDSIKDSRHKQYLIVYDESLVIGSLNKLLAHAELRRIEVRCVGFSLAEATGRSKVKTIAIGDRSLANAIIAEMEVRDER